MLVKETIDSFLIYYLTVSRAPFQNMIRRLFLKYRQISNPRDLLLECSCWSKIVPAFGPLMLPSHVSNLSGTNILVALKWPTTPLFYQPFVQAYFAENIKAPCTGPLWEESLVVGDWYYHFDNDEPFQWLFPMVCWILGGCEWHKLSVAVLDYNLLSSTLTVPLNSGIMYYLVLYCFVYTISSLNIEPCFSPNWDTVNESTPSHYAIPLNQTPLVLL